MIFANETTIQSIKSPSRKVIGKAELYNGSALVDTFSYNNALVSIDIERVGEEGKFFGFGVSHKATITLQDKDRKLNITTDNAFKIYFGDTEETYTTAFPLLYVSECNRDENTNALTVTAYCRIQEAERLAVGDLGLNPPYRLKGVANAISLQLCGSAAVIDEAASSAFGTEYTGGANLEGTETLREVLNDIAEATQTIFYFNADNKLTFKRLSSETALTIRKADYITLQSKTDKTLGAIVSTNELGDSVSASMSESGCTQYVRDNAFWELREDIATLVENALAAVGGLTINQFSCKWRGNYLAEIGDRLEIITKDNGSVFSYLLNDSISYSGGFSQNTQWSYTDNENETPANPSNLGEAIKQTFAKVDKANKEITLLTSKADDNSENISSLTLTTSGISSTVGSLEKQISDTGELVGDLKKSVDTQITAEAVQVQINSTLENGVDTTTGIVLNKSGLKVNMSGSDISTQISEDGMRIEKSGTDVLIANNEGVKAEDLHATTFLIIGNNSRLEDYNGDRTACFWVGG